MIKNVNGQSKDTVALRWWYEHGRSKSTKDEFLANRSAWEELQCHLHDTFPGYLPGHDDTKNYIRRFDKSGLLAADTFESAIKLADERRENNREFGCPEGPVKFATKISRIHATLQKQQLTDHYKTYINGPVWKKRSERYLEECCLSVDGQWQCEICGRTHERRFVGRTIQVHHNSYKVLNGQERNVDLLGCCDGICHQVSDIARRIQSGKFSKLEVNDELRTLFRDLAQ